MPALAPERLYTGLAALEARLKARPRLPDDVESLAEGDRERLEADWETWLRTLFRTYVSRPTGEPIPFARRHAELWEWVWGIQLGERVPPLVAIWPRGGAKSTSAELAAVNLGARGARRYALYVSGTQEQADDHVGNIAALLESRAFGRVYPRLAERMLGKYGSSKGWRRNRLRTAAGYTVDALGLDTAARGVKVEDARPDLIVVDDVDSEDDSVKTTARKIRTLTKRILPAGSRDLVVLFVQNLIHPDSIASRLVDGRAEFLQDRILSGPYAALTDLAYEQRMVGSKLQFVITAGTSTWEGQDLAACQAFVDTWGISSFLAEAQQRVTAPAGGIYSHLTFQHCRLEEVPDLVRVVVAVDPAVSDTDESDCQGINVDGISYAEKPYRIYRLFTWEEQSSPREALKKGLYKAGEFHADAVVIETDQGGDTWRDSYEAAWRDLKGELRERFGMSKAPRMIPRKAASEGSKVARAQEQVVDYERGLIVHVYGTHGVIEAALHRFPASKPLDAADASYWSWKELVSGAAAKVRGVKPVGIAGASKWKRGGG